MKKILYVLVRKDMTYSCPAVQAGHAIAAYMIHRDEVGWSNETLVYLGVEDGLTLEEWCCRLDYKDIKWYGFREPDYNDELTAIAVPLDTRQSRVFNRLNLL